MRQLIATCSMLEFKDIEPKISPSTSAIASRGHQPTRASSVFSPRRQPVPASLRSVCWATHSSTPIGLMRDSYLLQGGAAEDPRRADQHGDDEDGEHDQIGELGGDVRGGKGLAQPDEEATDHRARDAADAADDGGGERLEAGQ